MSFSMTMTKLQKNGRDRQRGAAAVEFALVLPLFMLLVMGAVDYGYFFFADQVVTNAAREGARSGTLIDPVNGTSAQAISAAQTAAYNYMKNGGVDCPTGNNACVTAVICPGGANCPSLPAGTTAVDVVINFTFRSLTGFTAVILPSRVYAHATMRWQ
jgi:Flp pilus assembly protein TadG